MDNTVSLDSYKKEDNPSSKNNMIKRQSPIENNNTIPDLPEEQEGKGKQGSTGN